MKVTAEDKTVMVYWQDGDRIQSWDQACIQAIELFGLPGDKFTTELNQNWMAFTFNTVEDALLFRLAI